MQKILFVYDRKLSKKSNQFAVKLSNQIKRDGRWEKVKPVKIYHARDLELVSRNVPDRSLFKVALESEMDQRRIEGRFFSPDEEFTVLRISSKYLFKFIMQCGFKKVLIDGDGKPLSFKIIKNALLEVEVKENSFDLFLAGNSLSVADFL